ncbi:thioredoxin TrxA [Halarsenatibacter silvermanii]|uniref:Thioredoxin n=1 Tax=Halarsenatibacter silvermanii TaxID=321763 RepID=A0A1G9N216_9FIRM|nr:thioredoxin domain-containing protein [Halarsenatibacter silvermanii]SDL80550.1 thioredoxin 1 [Halarsenatibacter silvermanii]
MLELDGDNFETEILEAEGLAVVDFWSESCEPCKELAPDFEELAEKYEEEARFATLDIQGNRRLALGQQVMGLPSIVIYEDGEKKEHLTGDDLTIDEVEDALQKYL